MAVSETPSSGRRVRKPGTTGFRERRKTQKGRPGCPGPSDGRKTAAHPPPHPDTSEPHAAADPAAPHPGAVPELPDRRRRRPARRPGHRQAGAGHGTPPASPPYWGWPPVQHARRPVPRADPPAQGRWAGPEPGGDVQPGRVPPAAQGRPAQLFPLDARDVLQPRQHPVGERPHPGRHARPGGRGGVLRRLREEDSRPSAASTSRCWASAAPGTSGSTSRAARPTAGPGW